MSVQIAKVLISDNVDKKCDHLLQSHGIDVVRKCNLSPAHLIEELESCNGLIVRSETKVTEEIINVSKNLKVIGRAGTGVDNIDVSAATKKGIIVLNAPNGNSISACELTCSFITCLARNINPACQSMKEGRWDRKVFAGGSELLDKTLAIIGLGKIGREVASRMQSFGMRVIGYDPFVSDEEIKCLRIKRLELDKIWPLADYITVHTPLIPQTKNLINESVFAKCKRGVRIINAARGGIINEEDLLRALNDGICAGAALDVFSEEPPKNSQLKALISHPNVIATPHLGASTEEAQIRVAVEVAEQFISLNDITSTFTVTGVLNAPALLASRKTENAGWIALAEMLGRVVSRVASETPLKGANIVITLAGGEIRNKKFLSTSILLGILSGKVQNGYNLINSPTYAKERGLISTFDDNDQIDKTDSSVKNLLKVSVFIDGNLYTSVQGTLIQNIPYLLQINDASFQLASARLTKDIQIYSCEPSRFASAINQLLVDNTRITNVAIAYGKQTWIVLSSLKNDETAASTYLNLNRY